MNNLPRRFVFAAMVSISGAISQTQATLVIETVPVGNAGNAGDSQQQGTFGAVSYDYRIAKHEVTNAQYTEFLNAVAAADPYALFSTAMESHTLGGIVRTGGPGNYSYAIKQDAVGQGPGGSDYSYANKPVVFVSWYDAVRFVNWLHNGQGSGDTQTGAYTLEGGAPIPANEHNITRNTGAKWFLPTEDEWYKAAYYDGNSAVYYDFATGTDATPNNNLPAADTGNSANFHDGGTTTGVGEYPFTDVGAYSLSSSPYGTYDQTGSLSEWTETLTLETSNAVRGGSWNDTAVFVWAAARGTVPPDVDHSGNLGFRIAAAAIPEPSPVLLLSAVTLLAVGVRWWWTRYTVDCVAERSLNPMPGEPR